MRLSIVRYSKEHIRPMARLHADANKKGSLVTLYHEAGSSTRPFNFFLDCLFLSRLRDFLSLPSQIHLRSGVLLVFVCE